jgi:tetratricopeptide (TPR) repeat protein
LACKTSKDLKNSVLALHGFQFLMENYSGEELCLVRLRFFEFLISPNISDFQKAKELLNVVFNDHLNGIKLPSTILQEFHFLTWNLGILKFKEKDFPSCLEWLQISMKPLPPDDKFNRSKTLRFLSRCHLELGQNQESLIAGKESESLDPKSFQNHYMMYKISLKEKNVDLAFHYLQKMSEDEEFINEYYHLAVQQGYESGSNAITLKSLNMLLEKTIPEKSAQILRSLIEISLDEEKKEFPD